MVVDERSGGKILVDALCSHGVSHIFCVPGESYLPVLDALLNSQSIRTIVCRQEGGAAMMADAYGKLTHRPVVAFSGDGCFLMTGQELVTAVQYELPVVIILVNNGMYGTIRMHQERRYPGRISGTNLVNPDFCELVRAFGAHAERVQETKEFIPALQRAIANKRPSLIELMTDSDGITPNQTLVELRDAAKTNSAST